MSNYSICPKLEYSDFKYIRNVTTKHTFIPKIDPTFSNIVVCSRCGLEGWEIRDLSTGLVGIKSRKPDAPCK